MVTKRLTREEAASCARLIFGTALGRGYYPTEEFLRRELERGISEDDCFLATDDGEAVGVVWFQRRGAFRSFPYLHLIVVREARSMYEKRGYREVTELDGLFRRKATEVLMVKRVVR